MPTYKINGHEVTGSAEAIDAIKQLMVDRTNLRSEVEDLELALAQRLKEQRCADVVIGLIVWQQGGVFGIEHSTAKNAPEKFCIQSTNQHPDYYLFLKVQPEEQCNEPT